MDLFQPTQTLLAVFVFTNESGLFPVTYGWRRAIKYPIVTSQTSYIPLGQILMALFCLICCSPLAPTNMGFPVRNVHHWLTMECQIKCAVTRPLQSEIKHCSSGGDVSHCLIRRTSIIHFNVITKSGDSLLS